MAEPEPQQLVLPYATQPLYYQTPVARNPVYLYGNPTVEYKQEKPKVEQYKKEEPKKIYYTSPQQYIYSPYVAHNPVVSHVLHKREAEPYFPYYQSTPYVASAPTTYAQWGYKAPVTSYFQPAMPMSYYTPQVPVTGYKTYANDAVSPQYYAGKGQYHADSVGAKHVAKREAEAEPLTPYVMPYAGYTNYANTYAYQPTTYGYTNPFIYKYTTGFPYYY